MKKSVLAAAFFSTFSIGMGTAWSADDDFLIDPAKALDDSKMDDLRGGAGLNLGSLSPALGGAMQMCAGSTSCTVSGSQTTTKMGPGNSSSSSSSSFSYSCAGGGCK